MKLQIIIMTIFLIFGNNSFSEVREISSVWEAQQEIERADIVILDIDNTLMRPIQILGSDQWFGYRVKYWLHEGLSKNKAIDKSIEEWTLVQNRTEVEITEVDFVKLIYRLQKQGTIVMGLTSRPPGLASTTLAQLDDLGIRFQANQTIHPIAMHPALYKNGILFVGPKNNKGIVLKEFFKEMSWAPKNVVFFDDKRKHVDSVEVVFQGTAINYMGFRYGFLDPWVASFDRNIADKEFAYFLKTNKITQDCFWKISCFDKHRDFKLEINRRDDADIYDVEHSWRIDVPGGPTGSEQLNPTQKKRPLVSGLFTISNFKSLNLI